MTGAALTSRHVGVILVVVTCLACTEMTEQDPVRVSEAAVSSNQPTFPAQSDACIHDSYWCGPVESSVGERADAAFDGFRSGSFSFARPVSVPQPPIPDYPLARFIGMNDYILGDQHHDAEYSGRLRIDGSCIYGIDIVDEQGGLPMPDEAGNSSAIFLSLPSAGTRQDPVTKSIWVWGDGPINDGDLITAGGGYDRDVPTECSRLTDGAFHAHSLEPAMN